MPAAEWVARLAARLRAHLVAKIAVLLGLSIGICVPYFGLQRHQAFAARAGFATTLDLRIPFEPGWIWVYASLALLVPLAPLLTPDRDGLVRYARGLAWLCMLSFAAFLLFPVAGPRPSVVPVDGLYALIVSVDRPLNSFPSLHAGLAVYSLLHVWRVLRDAHPSPVSRFCVALCVAWGGSILYSTLATKQHWLMDLPGGILVACAAHALAWRSAARTRRGVALAAE